jgi:hypothetical protein
LNNLPQKGIGKIVNSRIIAADKNSCDYILNKIYDEKASKDNKVQL